MKTCFLTCLSETGNDNNMKTETLIIRSLLLCATIANQARRLSILTEPLRSLNLKRRATELRQWFISTMGSITESARAVGRKAVKLAQRFFPFIPYNIYNCTLDRYLDITLDGDRKKAVKSGISTDDDIDNAIDSLTGDFQDALGTPRTARGAIFNDILRLNIEIDRLQIAKMLMIRDYQCARDILKDLGIGLPFESIADDMKKFDKVKLIIESQTNQRVKRVKDLRDKIKSRVDENSRVSRLDYVKSLTNLGASTEVGFKTDLNMTLAEYSALLNLYKEKQKQYEQIKQRHNHKR